MKKISKDKSNPNSVDFPEEKQQRTVTPGYPYDSDIFKLSGVIGPYELLLLFAVKSRLHRNHPSMTCWESQDSLAQRMHCGRSTIQRSIRSLKGRGLITVGKKYRRKFLNEYRISFPWKKEVLDNLKLRTATVNGVESRQAEVKIASANECEIRSKLSDELDQAETNLASASESQFEIKLSDELRHTDAKAAPEGLGQCPPEKQPHASQGCTNHSSANQKENKESIISRRSEIIGSLPRYNSKEGREGFNNKAVIGITEEQRIFILKQYAPYKVN